MNKLNLTVITFWLFWAGVGYLANGSHGALVALVGALGATLLADIFQFHRGR